MPNLNPNCSGSHCRSASGPVKVYPLGTKGTMSGNLILCHACFEHENNYRRQRGRENRAPENFPVVDWDKAEPHGVCECGHDWDEHTRTSNGAYACRHHGCGCRDVVL